MAKILITGSNVSKLKLVEAELVDIGHDVLKETNGRMVLERVYDDAPDMVIIDAPLEEVGEYHVCKEIKSKMETKRIPVVFITDHNGRLSHNRALDSGADEFISRPMDRAIVQVRLNMLLKMKKMSEEFISLQADLEMKVAQKTVEAMEASDAGLYALAKLAESRDLETGRHLDRIRRYSVILTNALSKMKGFSEKIQKGFISDMYRSSPLHDIGKVGIPDSILLKPGKLTPDEFEIMKSHTTIGANILKEAYNMMQNKPHFELSWIIALTHHEQYDGGGYPNGLKGKNIPLAGRIVALADVYDALVSKRIYKEAFTHEAARDVIANESGKHFDPDIVNAFIESEDQFLEIKRHYSDVHGP